MKNYGLSCSRAFTESVPPACTGAADARGRVIWLPVLRRPPAAAGARAIVAEHEADARGEIADALRYDGFAVTEAKDGAELLELVRGGVLRGAPAPDLIVTDARMPGAAVLESLAELRPLMARTQIVVIAAPGDEGAAESARRVGAVGVLSAPTDLDDLRTIALIAGRRARGR